MSTRRFDLDWGTTGASLFYTVRDFDEQILVARTALPNTTAGKEYPSGSGLYFVEIANWDNAWSGVIYWDDGTTTVKQVFDARTSAQSGGAAALANGPTVGDLITILRERARSAGIDDTDDSIFSAASKRLAIKTVLAEFVDRTRCTNQLDTVTISQGDAAADFSGIAGFHPERLKGEKLYIDGQNECVLPDLRSVLEARRCRSGATGSPEAFAFTGESDAVFWPTADAGYALKVMWSPPLTDFDVNDDAADDVALNVPTALAMTAIKTGGVAELLQGKVEDLSIIADLKKKFEEHVLASTWRGSIAGDHSQSMLRSRRTKWECFTGE